GADAILLDLEDAVAPEAKAGARAGLPALVAELAGKGLDVLVRVNGPLQMASEDLRAAVSEHVRAIVVPKVEDASYLETLGRMVAGLEADRSLVERHGRLGLVAMVESPAALPKLPAITAVERVVALALGSEDFSVSLGVPPTPASLTLPCQMIALAAA